MTSLNVTQWDQRGLITPTLCVCACHNPSTHRRNNFLVIPDEEKIVIRAAVEYFNVNTCIRFIERDTDEDITEKHILVTKQQVQTQDGNVVDDNNTYVAWNINIFYGSKNKLFFWKELEIVV